MDISLLSNESEVVLYGAGNLGEKICGILINKGIKIKCFIDANKKNTYYSGIPIISLSDYCNEKEIPVVISIFSSGADILEIFNNLAKSKKFSKIITFTQLYSCLASCIESIPKTVHDKRYFNYEYNYFWLSEDDSYLKNDKIDKIYNLLSDEKSKKLFNNTVMYRKSFSMDHYPIPETNGIKEQYLGSEIGLNCDNFANYIDIGAYDGDSIKNIYNKYGKFKKLIAIEPSVKNLNKLIKVMEDNEIAEEKFLFPVGISDEFKSMGFNEGVGNGEGDHFSEFAKDKLIIAPLDGLIFDFKPTFVKMDVEGSEKSALKGMKKIITKYKPCLAVSLYHLPEDILEIPLLVHELNDEYKLFMRQYSHNGFELVLYAV